MEEIRLNKYLSEAGVCSRREADRLIEAGKVLIDGEPARMGQRVQPGQKVQVGDTILGGEKEEQILLAVYKPPGVICTTDRREKSNIVDYVGYPSRIYPIGRLDKDSEGLILMTNDGSLVNRMMRSTNHHEKEYLVRVNKPVTDAFLQKMASGVRIRKVEKGEVLLDAVTRPCEVEKLGKMQLPHRADAGVEPADPPYVRDPRLPCGASETHPRPEHRAEGHEARHLAENQRPGDGGASGTSEGL